MTLKNKYISVDSFLFLFFLLENGSYGSHGLQDSKHEQMSVGLFRAAFQPQHFQ